MEYERRQLDAQVAVLETKIEQLTEEVNDLRSTFSRHCEKEEVFQDKILEQFGQINDKFGSIDSQLSKYQGVIGGLMLAASAIATFVGFFKDWLLDHFR